MTSLVPTETRLGGRDVGCILLVFALLVVHIVRTFDFSLPVYEDAAILMRYADHLAAGHGIVWNVDGQPVDGATDFFLMVTLAALGKCGLTIDQATYVLGFASHFATIAIVYVGVRRLHGAPRWMAFLSAAYLAFGPGIRYIEASFGTPYFALFSALAWYFATRAFRLGETTGSALAFAFSGLVLGLTRPEGVFLAGFMLLALIVTRGFAASRRTLIAFVAVFGTLGSAYFLWRWSHFGYPLPNTYYIKGAETVHWGHLRGGTKHIVVLTLPLLPILFFGVYAEFLAKRVASESDHREWIFIAFPIAAFTLLGVLHEGLMDYLHRFQYGLLPIVLFGWPPLLMRIVRLWGPDTSVARRSFARAFMALFIIAALGYQIRRYPTGGHKWWGTYNVAQILSEYSSDYTIAVTNAGHLPYVSHWNAIDGWGLNDQEIAHNGLTTEFLERHAPEIIQFDGGFSPLSKAREVGTPWAAATAVMKAYAESNDYILAAAFGVTPYKSHYYYVKRGFPDSEELVRRIREVDYYIGGAPARCFNFALVTPE